MINFLKEERGASLRNCRNLVLISRPSVVIFLFTCVEQIVAEKSDVTFGSK
jgi:hypothetical protein